jgi:hypothetical protein
VLRPGHRTGGRRGEPPHFSLLSSLFFLSLFFPSSFLFSLKEKEIANHSLAELALHIPAVG